MPRPGARISRRDLLRLGGAAAGAAAVAPLLAACETDAGGGPPFEGRPNGLVHFANWPLYVDREKGPDGGIVRPSLERFTQETGIVVNYREVIPDAESFYLQVQPYLAAGEPTGWDIMVITNGLTLSKMMGLDFLMELPADRRPNFDAHAAADAKDPGYDPGAVYSMPWQSGITGIAYNPALTGRDLNSIHDLFSEEFAGRVGMFGDPVDLPNLAMVALGIDPVTSTPDDWAAAAELLRTQRDDGIVGHYYNQNYVNALANGDVAVAMAWSGDIFQENAIGAPEGLQFVIPQEGALLWTDAMVVPKRAINPVDAITLMDYVYDPEVAAMIAGWVNYVTPVPGARNEILRMADEEEDPEEAARLRVIADSELVFPTDEQRASLKVYRPLEGDEDIVAWNEAFAEFYI